MPLQIFELPQKGHVYCMGLDPSKGGGGGDPAALYVMDATARPLPRQVALFRSPDVGQPSLAELAYDLHNFGYRLWRGYVPPEGSKEQGRSGGLVPESNEFNSALMLRLHQLFDDAYFFQQAKLPDVNHPDGRAFRFGFLTSTSTKPGLIGQLISGIEQHAFQWYDDFLERESNYWRFAQSRWTFGEEGARDRLAGHGDVTMALAFCWQGVLAVQARLAQVLRRENGQLRLVASTTYMGIGESDERAPRPRKQLREGATVAV